MGLSPQVSRLNEFPLFSPSKVCNTSMRGFSSPAGWTPSHRVPQRQGRGLRKGSARGWAGQQQSERGPREFLASATARSGLEGMRRYVLLGRPFCRLRLSLPSAAPAILCPGPGLRAAHALVPPLRDLAAPGRHLECGRTVRVLKPRFFSAPSSTSRFPLLFHAGLRSGDAAWRALGCVIVEGTNSQARSLPQFPTPAGRKDPGGRRGAALDCVCAPGARAGLKRRPGSDAARGRSPGDVAADARCSGVLAPALLCRFQPVACPLGLCLGFYSHFPCPRCMQIGSPIMRLHRL